MAMISMVGTSVVATIIVISVWHHPKKMPPWVKTVFLDGLSKLVCLNFDIDSTTVSKSESKINNGYSPDADLALRRMSVEGSTIARDPQMSSNGVDALVSLMKEEMLSNSEKEHQHLLWQRVSIVIDRSLFFIFTIFTVVTSITVLVLGGK